jgi:hypothetical protein
MLTVCGQVCTFAGLVQKVDLAGVPHPSTTPSSTYLRHQPAVIPVHFDHDESWKLGEVVHLERSRRGLMMVARLDADVADLLNDGDWFISDGITSYSTGITTRGGVLIRELSLVRATANINTAPLCWSPGDIACGTAGAPFGLPLYWRDTWKRAGERASGMRYRPALDSLSIVDLDDLDAADEVLTDPAAARRQLAVLRAELDALPRPTPIRTRASSNPSEDRVYAHHYPSTGLYLVGGTPA